MVVETRTEAYNPLADLKFQYPLRRYQKEILELVQIKLERGERALHIVAPPGAGKTIIGLQLITQFQEKGICPALVLCPNTTIQSQWGQKLELFLPPEMQGFPVQSLIGTHEDKPLKPITLLTYQVLSTPGREIEYLEKLAHQSWLDELTRSLSLSAGEAELRILELLQNNKKAYQKEMSRHVSRLRRRLTEVLKLEEVLHGNAIELIQALRRQKFGLVLFDECHHLTDYWSAVMTHLIGRLEDPVVIGLTGTPPEGKSARQETRYLSLVGEIDYQVPTPALVKEGGLAPYQDLVYFTQPTEKEMQFLEGQHEEFHLLLEELAAPSSDGAENSQLTVWILQRVESNSKNGFDTFMEKEPDLAAAIGRYLWKLKLPLPAGGELSESLRQSPLIDDWMLLLEDFALHCLKTSAEISRHKLYERIKNSIRKIGYGLTEQGIRKQASPVDRVLAYSQSKPEAAATILNHEYRYLEDRLRAIVVTDFEHMAATSTSSLKGVLDAESGGAIAVMRTLLAHPISEYLNPCLVTGSLLLIDLRARDKFLEAARKYISDEGFTFELLVKDSEGYAEITAGVSQWETRLYVGMATSIFERGITKCLVGTRGIFGEGWDSQSLNTLIDLTTSTSPVSVKQLRGRSIRLQTNDPLGARKVANNWDVVAIAPQLEKGLNDYQRFARKHQGFFGISDDGQIECGVGHVHPSFSELSPAEVFACSDIFNQEMLDRSLIREKIYDLWKVGQPYSNRLLGCIEVSLTRKLALTPPHIRLDMKYKDHARYLRHSLNAIWLEYAGGGLIVSLASLYLLQVKSLAPYPAFLPFFLSLYLAWKRYISCYRRMQQAVCQPNTQESSLFDIAVAIVSSLQEIKLLPNHISREDIKINLRADGSYRVFLDQVSPEISQHFVRSFQEALAPVSNQPYLIPKYEFTYPKPRGGKDSEGAFFRNYLRGKAEAKISGYHAVPKLLARSEKGRAAFESAWNKYVSPGFVIATETKPELLQRYFGIGPSLAERLIWE